MTDKLREYNVEKASTFKTATELHRNTDQNMMTPLDFQDSESAMLEDGDDDEFFMTMDGEILTPIVPKDEILTPDFPKEEILASAVPKDEILTPAVPKEEILTRDIPKAASNDPKIKVKQEDDDEVFSDEDLFPDMNDDILKKQNVDSDDEFLSSIDDGLLLPDSTNLQSSGIRGVYNGVKHDRDAVNTSSSYGMPKEPIVDCHGTFLSSIDSSFLFPSETNMRYKSGGAVENALRRARLDKATGNASSTYGMPIERNVDSYGAVQSSICGKLFAGDTKTQCRVVRDISSAVEITGIKADASPDTIPESDDEVLSCMDESLLSPGKTKPVGKSNENDSLMDTDSDEEIFSSIDENILSPEKSKKVDKGAEKLWENRKTMKEEIFLGGDIKPKHATPNDFDSDDEFFGSIDEKILSPEKSKTAEEETGKVLDGETLRQVLFLRESPSDDSNDDLFPDINDEISEKQNGDRPDKKLIRGIVEAKSSQSKIGPDRQDMFIDERDPKRWESRNGKCLENVIRGDWRVAGKYKEGLVSKQDPSPKGKEGWLGNRNRNSEEEYFSASEDMEENLRHHSERLRTKSAANETDHCKSCSKGDKRTIDLFRNRGNIPLNNHVTDCRYVELFSDEIDPEVSEAATQYYLTNDERDSSGINLPNSKQTAGSSNSQKNRLETQGCRTPKNGLIIDENNDELLTQYYSTQSTVSLSKDIVDSRFLSDDNSDEEFLSDIDDGNTESREVSSCRGSTSKRIIKSSTKEQYSFCSRNSHTGSKSADDNGDIGKSDVRSHPRAYSCSDRSSHMELQSRDDFRENLGTHSHAKTSRRELFESWSADLCERLKDNKS